MKNLTCKCLLVLFTLAPFAFGQNKSRTETAQWKFIESPKKDLSFSVPADFLIDKENKKYRIIAYQESVTMRVEIDTSGDFKDRLRSMRKFGSAAKISRFTLGDFIGDVYEHDQSKRFLTSIFTASSKAFYFISISSKDIQSPLLVKFLYSIKLDGRPLYKSKDQPEPKEEAKILIDTLETSPVILEALKKEDAAQIEIKYDFDSKEKSENFENDEKYSRPFIILRQPIPGYRAAMSMERPAGSVMLKVLFRADGSIGAITVLQRPDNGLMKSAVEAARKIKFLPAEINGKPVDVTRILRYDFI